MPSLFDIPYEIQELIYCKKYKEEYDCVVKELYKKGLKKRIEKLQSKRLVLQKEIGELTEKFLNCNDSITS